VSGVDGTDNLTDIELLKFDDQTVTVQNNTPPTGTVTLSGTATQGQTLTASNTLADADGPASLTVSYQWRAAGIDIIGATLSTYLLTQSDVGKTITVVASYTDATATAESVTSNPSASVANLNDLPSGAVTLSANPVAGQNLTVSNTLTDADGPASLSISYQWRVAGIDIAGATTNQYTPTLGDAGKAITVQASYTDAYGTHESVTSSASALVALNLIGTTGVDTLTGAAGADTLNGGAGADRLYGAGGDDTYYADLQGDLIFESAGQGNDSVISSSNFYLYANVENLSLGAGAGNLFGSGNALDNTMTGNEGDNLLLGWDGSDTLIGNAGADILYGVEGADSLLGGAGIDVLIGGNGADSLDGGADSDALYGEAADDILYGGTGFVTDILVAGEGNDTLDGSASLASGQTRNQGDYDRMYGQAGDDTYYVDTPADLTFEDIGGGTDTVIADINGGGYYLYANVENLTLAGNTPFGVGNELNNILTGSAQANWLLGGAGNDTLNGKGGNDVLFGQDGVDTFVFERGTGGDVIGDYTAGVDKIKLTGIGYQNWSQLQGHLVENAGTTAIDLGQGDFVVLVGVALNTLGAGDFVLA
jgi:Ca2+-binding RTX toxin-like protein